MKTKDKDKIILDESGLSSGAGISEKSKSSQQPNQGLSTGEGEEAGDFAGTSDINKNQGKKQNQPDEPHK